jgi:protein-tyrosine-phosphatase
MKILFICRGNVGRSQMGEVIFNMLTDSESVHSENRKHVVMSAGTRVISKEGESRHGQLLKDLPAANFVIDVLKEKGFDSSQNARTQLTPAMVDWADKIIVMAEPHTFPDYLANSPKTTYWEVADPKGTPIEEHRAAYDQIESLIKDYIKEHSL